MQTSRLQICTLPESGAIARIPRCDRRCVGGHLIHYRGGKDVYSLELGRDWDGCRASLSVSAILGDLKLTLQRKAIYKGQGGSLWAAFFIIDDSLLRPYRQG